MDQIKKDCDTVNNELNDVKTKVKLLEKDIELVYVISEKRSVTIEKIQEMNNSLVQRISLHDQKHLLHDKEEKELKDDIKDLNTKIASVSHEIHERVDQLEHHISSRIDASRIDASRIDALRGDLLNHEKEDSLKASSESDTDGDLDKRIAEIEKWRWMIVGAVAFAAWFIGQADIIGKLMK